MSQYWYVRWEICFQNHICTICPFLLFQLLVHYFYAKKRAMHLLQAAWGAVQGHFFVCLNALIGLSCKSSLCVPYYPCNIDLSVLLWVFGKKMEANSRKGPQVGLLKSILDISLCLISVLVRFYIIFSLIGPPTMVAEAPDQHHSGLGCLEDGRNGLTAPNICLLYTSDAADE